MNWFLCILELIFGCRHPENLQSRPFTNEFKQSYCVCLGCGKHRFYDLARFRFMTRREIRKQRWQRARAIADHSSVTGNGNCIGMDLTKVRRSFSETRDSYPWEQSSAVDPGLRLVPRKVQFQVHTVAKKNRIFDGSCSPEPCGYENVRVGYPEVPA
jgi:hypothetical protein